MTKKDGQDPEPKAAPEETRKSIELIATGVDFKPYLDAVGLASQRTRFTVYVLIAALLILLTAYRNTSRPDWLDKRLTKMQTAAACLRHESGDLRKARELAGCADPLDYAQTFMFLSSKQEEKSVYFGGEFQVELDEQIRAVISQRTEALTLHLPFFGLAIDMNDLGMIVGLLIAAVLYVLYASLRSESDNVERARRKAERGTDETAKKDNLELLLMSQVLALPSEAKGSGRRGSPAWAGVRQWIKAWVGIHQGVYVLFVMAALMHLWVVYDDLHEGFSAAVTLQGRSVARFETGLEVLSLVLVWGLCFLCFQQQWKLNRVLSSMTGPGGPGVSTGPPPA
jgi:hypothetical protein